MYCLPRPLRSAFAFLIALTLGCAPHFDGSRFITHVAFLASDSLAGRGVGTPGIDQAAEYIARQFREAGLRPAGDDGTWFQEFEVGLGQQMLGKPSLTVTGAPAEGVLEKDFVPFPFSTADPFEGPLAFVGYGITNDQEEYDDYEDFDATGKVLLMLRYEPHAKDPKAKFGGQTPSEHAAFRTKAMLARTKGAVGILVVNPPLHHGDRDYLFAFNSVDHVGRYNIPMLHVSQDYANRLLKAARADDLATLQKALDARQRRTMDLKGLTVRGDPGLVRRKAIARNVLAVLPGSGPDADEYLVIGAHYDHLGRTAPRKSTRPGPVTPEIHNGADDNASGTAGVIELARSFARRGLPNRSILFIAFSAEERGLFGSKHYVEHPTVPLDKTVAMLNLDMIGRLRRNRLLVFGTDTGENFSRLIKYHGNLLGLRIQTSGGGSGGSDHLPFHARQIPALHFCTGVHSELHAPGDDTETLNAEGGARVMQLVYSVANSLARAPATPKSLAAADRQASPRTPLKVRLGVMPSYAGDGLPGLLIEGTASGSPADRAGLREGDRILKMGNTEVNDVYGLMEAMRGYNPGDKVTLLVMHEGKRVEMGVTLEAGKRE